MDKVFELFVALQTRMLVERDEKGQGTLEYVGMIIVAAILAVAVLEVTNTIDLGGIFSNQVSKVTDFGG